ncbi:SDR family oxidoreductase [Actinoallomurus sp. NPDC052274]|uniref:SDR family NAD(P)-dependent oxidoreductase n=1 Tax=Actinoallomurus sp. NPDC052274 TaxID=3155420 RepID=UPI00341865BE
MTDSRRIALVTGCGSGICAAVAHGLAERGMRLLLVDRDPYGLARTGRAVEDALVADPLVLDVTDAPAVEDALRSLPAPDRPDVLVNGVGGDTRAIPFAELTEADLHMAVTYNLTTAFTMTRLCAPTMAERGWGRIVNFASVAGRTYTHVSNAAYVAAKAAVIGLTKQCAYEFGPMGITVNAVAHGVIGTDRVAEAWRERPEQWRQSVLARIPVGRPGTVTEAAAIVCHLCGEEAGYTTGAVIDVNGGLHI